MDRGYFPGDADIDDFYFGDTTQAALMTMQVCVCVQEVCGVGGGGVGGGG